MEDVTQLQDLLNQNNPITTTNSTPITAEQLVLWITVPSMVIIVLLLLVFISNAVRRHKLEKAIFEIRDILREMQQQTDPAKATVSPETPQEIVANK